MPAGRAPSLRAAGQKVMMMGNRFCFSGVMCGIAAILLLGACNPSPPRDEHAEAVGAQALAADETAGAGAPDSVASRSDPAVSRIKGHYVLWEDFEGGRMCQISLTDTPTIGGFAATADDACVRQLGIAEDVFAWFIAPDDGWLVLIDATRRILLRLQPQQDGSFYAVRTEMQLPNLMLSVPVESR